MPARKPIDKYKAQSKSSKSKSSAGSKKASTKSKSSAKTKVKASASKSSPSEKKKKQTRKSTAEVSSKLKKVSDSVRQKEKTAKRIKAEKAKQALAATSLRKAEAEQAEKVQQTKSNNRALVKGDFSPENASRETLILEYSPLIKYIAQRIAARLPANIELDDLISSGVIGLMDAIDKFDSSRDNKFKTYAEFRIRGAILDELRAQDWVPRSVREKAKQLERCYSKIEQEKGRQATDEEVCKELNITQEEYHDMLNQVRSVSLLSFDEITNISKAERRSAASPGENGWKMATPYSEVNAASLKKVIADAICDLPEKQRLVLSLYYYEDLNLKEIGRVLDVTESRVSQLHTQAILRLKGRLRNYLDDFTSIMA